MSVRDTQARLATPGEEVIVPADAGHLTCLAAIDDANDFIQNEVVLKSGVPEAASLSNNLFKDCDSSEKLAAVLYGSRPNVVLVGEITEYDKMQNAIKRLLTDLPMLGRFVAILLEPVSDSWVSQKFGFCIPAQDVLCRGITAEPKLITGVSIHPSQSQPTFPKGCSTRQG